MALHRSCYIHEAETTRSQDPLQAGNSADQLRLRTRTRHFQITPPPTVTRAAAATATRIPPLRDLVHDDLPRLQAKEARLKALEQEFGNAEELRQRLEEQDSVLLSLREERLRLRDQLDAREGCR